MILFFQVIEFCHRSQLTEEHLLIRDSIIFFVENAFVERRGGVGVYHSVADEPVLCLME